MRKRFFLLIYYLAVLPFFVSAQEEEVYLNNPIDTIATGISFPVKGKYIDPDSVEAPEIILAKIPRQSKIYNNVVSAKDPEIIFIKKETLHLVTLGGDEFPFPSKINIPHEVVPAIHPKPTPASPPAFTDIATHDIRHIDVEQGLSNSYFRTVFEDSRGYLWFSGGDRGVCRYDGKSFMTYTEDEGLLNDFVRAIFEDRKGNLWFGTGDGFCKFDGTHFTNYSIGDVIRFIFEDSKNRIWFASENGGAGYFDTDGSFTHITEENGLLSNHVTSIAEDKNGNIWFGTGDGICKYDGKSFTYVLEENGLLSSYINKILIDKEEHIWAATDRGVSRFDGKSISNFTTAQGLSHHVIWDIIIDRKSNLWFGTRRGGACKFDGKNFTHYGMKEGLNNIEALSLFEDSRGQIWMPTYGGGINVFNSNSFAHLTVQEGLSHNVVNHIIEDRNQNIWMATEGSGVMKFDSESISYYTTREGLSSNEIASITEDSQGNIWFATFDEGVSKYDGKYFTNYGPEHGLLAENIGTILEDKNGNIWFTAEDDAGLFKFDGIAFTHFSEKEGLLSNYIMDIIEDKKGNLWIGGEGGLTKFDGKNFTHYTTNEGLINNYVGFLIEDSRQNIWTCSDGISKFDGNSFTSFTTKDGIENLTIWGIQEDHRGNIWIGTEKGFYFLDLEKKGVEKKELRFIPFHKADGLKGEDVRHRSICLDSKNQIWWGTGKSVTRLDLNDFYKNRKTRVPKTQLNSIFINETYFNFFKNNHEALKEETLNLFREKGIEFEQGTPFQNFPTGLKVPYDLNHFTFDFIAIDHVSPHKITYQHIIEGLEKNWSTPTKENKIDYRSIPFGSYIFKVRAKGASGIWGAPLEFPFTIRPPWWHSSSAYFIYFLLLTGLLYLIFSFLKKRWILQNELKREQEEAIRLKELDTFKSNFYTNITHEFRTPLTVILGMAREIKEQPQKHLEEGIQLIERNGKRLLMHINQILDLSKLENNSVQLNPIQDDIIVFLNYSTESFQSFANGQNISLRFFSNKENLVMDFDPDYLQKIMVNLISNALKFTPSGGEIKVRVQQENKNLIIEVKDCGVGIPTKDLSNIFDRFYQASNQSLHQDGGTGIGLAHTKELVKIMDGTISVKSKEGEGTSFFVQLPITRFSKTASASSKKEPSKIDFKKLNTSRNKDEKILDSHFALGVKSVLESNDLKKKDFGKTDLETRLLIVEDNADVVIYLKNCLEGFYQIDVAYNGRIGIEKAIENIPDLIISDVMMPEKNGFEVCDFLKNDERTSHIPIILLTAKADVTSKIAGLRRGADAYLSKPFDKEELLVRLEKLVERQKKMVSYFSQKNHSNENSNPIIEVEEAIQIEDAFIQKIKKIIEENYSDENFALPQLCQKIRMSRSQLFRKMKALIDTSPSDFIRTFRLEKAKQLLETTEMNVSEISWEVGFKDVSHFSKTFQAEFGHLPSATNN